MISANFLSSHVGRGSRDDWLEGAQRMSLMMLSTRMSEKSWVGSLVKAQTLVTARLQCWLTCRRHRVERSHKIVVSEAGTRRTSGVPQQMFNGWPKLAWFSSFFAYLQSPKLLTLDAKSLMHVADSRPPSRVVTSSPCSKISPLESPSTLL